MTAATDRRRLELWLEAARLEHKHRLNKPDILGVTIGNATGNTRLEVRPFEHLFALRRINNEQFAAGEKYRIHWHRGGLDNGGIRTIDFDCIHGGDVAGQVGMPRTEAQVSHREEIRKANAVVGDVGRRVIEAIVIEDKNLVWVGFGLGWGNRPQATAAALQALRMKLDMLCGHWSI